MDWVSPAHLGASGAHARRQSTSPGARPLCRARSPRPSPLTRSSPGARRIGTEATLAVFDDLAWELARPQEFAVFGPGIPAPARDARAPFVELHREHQMDEIAAVRIEDMPGDIPLVQSLHDDDLGRGRRIGLAGRQRLVVGPDCLFPLDVAL